MPDTSQMPNPQSTRKGRHRLRRAGRILAWTLGLLIGVPVVLVIAFLIYANTGPGRHTVESLASRLTGNTVRIQHLGGRFPDRLKIGRLELADAKGVYFSADNTVLNWSPAALIHKEMLIDRLSVNQATLERMPVSSGKTSSSSSGLPVRVVLKQLQLDRLNIAAPVAGQPVALTAQGSGALDSYSQGKVQLTAHRLDAPGQYSVDAAVEPSAIHAVIKAEEPPHGLIAGIAQLPDLGGIAIDAKVNGPRDALATDLGVHAGPLTATATGTVNLTGETADLTVAADAPAMAPRPDIAWQSVHLHAAVHGQFKRPQVDGVLTIADLKASGGSVGITTVDVSGNSGAVQVHAVLNNVVIPGSAPDLLSKAPLVLDATAQLDAPDRPIVFDLHHPLIALQGRAQTEGTRAVTATLKLPNLAPLAAMAGRDLEGSTDLALTGSENDDATNVAVKGTIGITGGTAPVPQLLGEDARIDIAGAIHGQDLTLSRFLIDGRTLNATASGGLTGGEVALNWAIRLTDLSVVRPTLSGQVNAQGSVTGPRDNLAMNADLTANVANQGYKSGTISAHVEAQGLPDQPTGRLTAQGTLLDAPLSVALVANRTRAGDMHLAIDQLSWKSLNASGQLGLAPGAKLPTGQIGLTMTNLADLRPLLGTPIEGSANITLNNTDQEARIAATIQGVSVPGSAGITKGDVNATVTDLTTNPVIDGEVALSGVHTGGTTGSVRVTARGATDNLGVKLTAVAAELAGSPAKLDAAATVDAMAKTVDVSSLTGSWKQQDLRLLAPVKVAYANGLTLSSLRLGYGKAELVVAGRASPTLDLSVRLRNLPADVAAIVSPQYAANGTISAEGTLTGTLSKPSGIIRVNGQGLQLRNGAGSSLPPAALIATANLAGTTARLDTRVTVASTHLALTGTAPLTKTGRMDLRAGGVIDLAMLDPLLSSEGRRVRGKITLNLGIAGTVSKPAVSGTIRLAEGDAQDFSLGAHVTNINATIEAAGDVIRLVRLTGDAGAGTIGASGTVGLTGDMPIDLRMTARNARPVSSDLLTAVINADLTVRGALEGNMTAGGTLRVQHADIRVPDTLPRSVAVLPVSRPGTKPAPPSTGASQNAPVKVIALDLTLDAPEQVFIRGRGLYAELGGKIHIGGTTANPQPSGGLHLIRGTFSLVGQTLNFTSGTIQFTGAGLTNPSINFVASATTSSIVATLTVSGSVTNPQIKLSSVPEQPADEILAQLLFNTTTSKLSPLQVAEIASALATLSGASPISNPLDSLRSTLGLDRLSIGSGTNGAPAVEAGRYIGRGVYVGAKQNATGGGTQATVEVNLAKGLKLETTAGNGNTTATGASTSGNGASVGLTYQFQY